jgi:hypothetical protein
VCEGHTSCICPYIGVRFVSWTGGGIQVSTRRNEGCQRTMPMRLCACGDSAMQGSRRHTHSHVSWANGVGGARLRCRAAGGGILAGAATGGSRAAAIDDTMIHGTRRRCDGSRWQVAGGQWGGVSNRRVASSMTGNQPAMTRGRGAEGGGIGGRRPRQVGLIC